MPTKPSGRVCEDHAPIIVTHKGCASVVMISLDDREALEETSDLLRSPKGARRSRNVANRRR